jgi:CHAT domain-containing protein
MGQEEQQSFIENPMLRSGLAFRGANHPFNEGEDGLLTAFEIANIDLFGTELVVLSACETGVGETKIGEGVTGLKRALFLAGSKTQVLSLWKVDDFATRTLMTEWYSALLNGDDRVESLQDVQLRMATNQLSEENASQADEDRSSSLSLPHETETGDDNFSGWSHPYYWAAFTISGNDGPVSLEQ